jgi:hypothetical protein
MQHEAIPPKVSKKKERVFTGVRTLNEPIIILDQSEARAGDLGIIGMCVIM